VLVVGTPVIGGLALGGAWAAAREGALKAAGVILLLGLGAILGIFAFVASAWKHLRIALRERPSDVEIEGGTMRVVGGRWDGRIFDLESAESSVQSTTRYGTRIFDFSKMEPLATETVEIVSLRVDDVDVAMTARPVEKESLRALLDTLRTQTPTHRRAASERKAPAAKVALMVCGACGAPAVPEARDVVACGHCGAAVPVPPELRERVRALAVVEQTRPRSESRLTSLLEQPSAATVNAVMVALGVPLLLVWPAAAAGIAVLVRRGTVGVVNVALLVGVAVVAILAIFSLMRGTLVNRQALSLISARFGAIAPRKPGDPHACRSCLAPLADRPEQLLVHCAYCGAENITGLDLRSEAHQEEKQARSLDEELSRRRRERTLWRLLALLSVGALGACVWVVPYALTPHSDHGRCRSGDASACLREGRAREKLDTGEQGGDEVVAALDAFKRGCERGAAEGCRQAARVVYTWRRFDDDAATTPVLSRGCDAGDGRACDVGGDRLQKAGDLVGARESYRKGCDAGHLPACSDLGFLYSSGKGVAEDKRAAMALYRRACDGGFALACSNTAWLLEHGSPPDLAAAAPLFERACTADGGQCATAADYFARRCEAGDHGGCRRAVDLYLPLKGATTKDERHAYELGCKDGYGDGCYGAGRAEQGDSDYAHARGHFEKACDGGSASSCNALGVLLVKGWGGKKDPSRALPLYEKACGLGLQVACENVQALRAKGR